MKNTPYHWPHEASRDTTRVAHTTKDVLEKLTSHPVLYLRALLDFYSLAIGYCILKQNDLQKYTMGIVNGHESTPLASKSEFPRIIRELGYRSPTQCIVSNNCTIDEFSMQLRMIFGETFQEKSFLVKPLHGSQGNGVHLFPHTVDKDHIQKLFLYSTSLQEELILQEYIPSMKEGRIILHKDPQNTEWRFYFEAQKPMLLGDGVTTFRDLVDMADIPDSRKEMILRKNAHKLGSIPLRDEVIPLAVTGNTMQEAWQVRASEERQMAIDEFFQGFMKDLTFAYPDIIHVAFDVLYTDSVIISKDTVVFLELQMPHGLEGPWGRFGSDSFFMETFGPTHKLRLPWLLFYRNVVHTIKQKLYERLLAKDEHL